MVASVAVMKTQLNACIMFLLRVVLFGRGFLVQKEIVTASTMGIPDSGWFVLLCPKHGEQRASAPSDNRFFSLCPFSVTPPLPHIKPSSELHKAFKEACSPEALPLQNGSWKQHSPRTSSDLGVESCSHSLTPGNT